MLNGQKSNTVKEFYAFTKYDNRILSKWLTWKRFFELGLSLDEAKVFLKTKYLQKIRTYFSKFHYINENEFICYLTNMKFSNDKAYELYQLASSNNLEHVLYFISEFYRIIEHRNHTLEFFLNRGWSHAESRLKLKEFFLLGSTSSKKKRKKSMLEDLKYRQSRSNGGIASNIKNGSCGTSKFENILKDALLQKNYIIDKFYSPVVDFYLKLNKRNFIHDFIINNELIVEYNGTYWHKDAITSPTKFTENEYLYEFKKAVNCLHLVKRKNKLKYLILWEDDIKNNINTAIYLIDKALNDRSGTQFFSSRSCDTAYYLNTLNTKRKEFKSYALFSDLVTRYAAESHCLSKKVAAIAVKNGHVVATGINGTLPGKINCDEYFKWYHAYYNIQIEYSEWITTKEWRDIHHEWSNINEVHAEMQLVSQAAKEGINLSGSDIYVSMEPCMYCTKLLATLDLHAIYYINSYDKTLDATRQFAKEIGIIFEQLKPFASI